jgi:hypothetical protein
MSTRRVDFIVKLQTRGFDYVDAVKAYEAMVSVFEDSIIRGARVGIGKVGALVPTRLPPKVVHMGFQRENGQIKKVSREYILGRRVRYKFNLHRSFIRRHSL